MAGFLGLFGSNNGNGRSEEEFYLDSDQAKTLGDIDYMRTSRQIKRTYAKYKNGAQGGMKVIKQISATSDFLGDDLKATSAESTFTPSETSFNNSANSSNGSNSRADTEMDMFREMAKEIKKPR
jgi:hypothetical protein